MVSLKLKLTNIYHYLDKQDIGLVYDRTARNGKAGEIFEMKKILPTMRSAPTTFRLLARHDSHCEYLMVYIYRYFFFSFPCIMSTIRHSVTLIVGNFSVKQTPKCQNYSIDQITQKREVIIVYLPNTSHFIHFQSVRQKKWKVRNKINKYRWHFRSKSHQTTSLT